MQRSLGRGPRPRARGSGAENNAQLGILLAAALECQSPEPPTRASSRVRRRSSGAAAAARAAERAPKVPRTPLAEVAPEPPAPRRLPVAVGKTPGRKGAAAPADSGDSDEGSEAAAAAAAPVTRVTRSAQPKGPPAPAGGRTAKLRRSSAKSFLDGRLLVVEAVGARSPTSSPTSAPPRLRYRFA